MDDQNRDSTNTPIKPKPGDVVKPSSWGSGVQRDNVAGQQPATGSSTTPTVDAAKAAPTNTKPVPAPAETVSQVQKRVQQNAKDSTPVSPQQPAQQSVQQPGQPAKSPAQVSSQPSKPNQPSRPTQPAKPIEPTQPSKPSGPAQSVQQLVPPEGQQQQQQRQQGLPTAQQQSPPKPAQQPLPAEKKSPTGVPVKEVKPGALTQQPVSQQSTKQQQQPEKQPVSAQDNSQNQPKKKPKKQPKHTIPPVPSSNVSGDIIPPKSQPQQKVKSKKKKSLRRFIFALVFVVLLAAAGIGLYYAYSSGMLDPFLDPIGIDPGGRNGHEVPPTPEVNTTPTATPTVVEDTTSLRYLGDYFKDLEQNATQLMYDLNFGDKLNFNSENKL